MNSESLSKRIKAEAKNLGFFACGIAKADAVDEDTASHLRHWLATGGYAGMDYMSNYIDKRLDPRLLMPGLKSIVSVALNYTPATTLRKDAYQLAAYALGQDYHDIVKGKLRQLATKLGYEDALHCKNEDAKKCRIFVDSGPILERYWAMKAGLGWTGKNHQLIIPRAGSMFFLGELLIDTELPEEEYDSPMTNRCGNCRKCIEACPTQALLENEEIKAERCLSYQLIENRGELSETARQKQGNSIYGCDRCQQACPWNRYAVPNTTPELQPKPELLQMTNEAWQELTEDDYRQLFKGSAVKRAKYTGLIRNINALKQKNKE